MDESRRASPAVILACLGAAGLFEVLTLVATQDKTVRAASPWQDDPYDAMVSLAAFIARPPRTRARRVAETSVVAGCLAIYVAVAFRDPLWAGLGAGSLTSVPALVALTLGAGLVTSLATACVLLTRRVPTTKGMRWKRR